MLTVRLLFLAKNVLHYTISLMFVMLNCTTKYFMSCYNFPHENIRQIRRFYGEFSSILPLFPWICTWSIPVRDLNTAHTIWVEVIYPIWCDVSKNRKFWFSRHILSVFYKISSKNLYFDAIHDLCSRFIVYWIHSTELSVEYILYFPDFSLHNIPCISHFTEHFRRWKIIHSKSFVIDLKILVSIISFWMETRTTHHFVILYKCFVLSSTKGEHSTDTTIETWISDLPRTEWSSCARKFGIIIGTIGEIGVRIVVVVHNGCLCIRCMSVYVRQYRDSYNTQTNTHTHTWWKFYKNARAKRRRIGQSHKQHVNRLPSRNIRKSVGHTTRSDTISKYIAHWVTLRICMGIIHGFYFAKPT